MLSCKLDGRFWGSLVHKLLENSPLYPSDSHLATIELFCRRYYSGGVVPPRVRVICRLLLEQTLFRGISTLGPLSSLMLS